jgi:methionine-rich copper-binding protein CopC
MNKQFFFLPGLMAVALGMTHLTGAQNLSDKSNEVSIKKSKEDPLLKTGPLPIISWIYPDADFASSAVNKMDLHATVKLSTPAKEIKLAVRNSEDGTQLVQKSIKTNEGLLVYEVKVPVTLPDGSYNIELEVITTDGVAVSEKRRVMIGQGALDNVLSLDRKDYALLFGTDKYDHWTDLVNPIDDVRAIGKELKEKYGFQVEIVENPSVEDIWKKLRELNERKFSSQDQLFVFFAGHGHYDETFGEGYVVAKNSLENDLSRNSYISHNRLRGVISNIQCNHILLTMDVCFGGTLDPVLARSRGGKKDNEATISEMLARKWSHKTRKYLTSGGKEYVSDGIPGKHSPFSEKLIESLRGMGGSDFLLTLAEIQVELEKLKQLPRMGSFGDDEPLSDFVFVGKRGN